MRLWKIIILAPAATLACATSRPPTRPDQPTVVIPDSALCVGTPEHPAGERDPACAPDATHEQVELIDHLAGCRAGVRGPAEFRIGDQLLATLRPGERKSLSLPRGDVALVISEDGRSETRSFMLAGSGPLRIELGCPAESFVGGLQPLVLEGAHGPCAVGDQPIRVRAGGLELEVGRDQVQTLFLPQGSHIVKVDDVERIVELGSGGAVVPLATCDTSAP